MLDTTLVVPVRFGIWREDLMHRLQETTLPQLLRHLLAAADWRRNGHVLLDEVPSSSLLDETMRLPATGLLGGMPPKKDYSLMALAELRKACTGTPVCKQRKNAKGKWVNKIQSELLADLQSWADGQEDAASQTLASPSDDVHVLQDAEEVLSSEEEQAAAGSSGDAHALLDSKASTSAQALPGGAPCTKEA